jgi:hypothetical protein
MSIPDSANFLNSLMNPIETVIGEILGNLSRDTEFKDAISEKLKNALNQEGALEKFTNWLKTLENFNKQLKAKRDKSSVDVKPEWFDSILNNHYTEDLAKKMALDCLQVMVFAYLPGPRYFKCIYIHSNIHNKKYLEEWKESFQVPHLNGALGWMTACALGTAKINSYVTIDDAQLDLRGRVAVPDLWLGNRSVLGFPLSSKMGNDDLSLVSGFVFFSYPVPGIFPQHPASDEFSKVFVNIRKNYESILAYTIESHIFRLYSRSLLSISEKSNERERTPLLKLSSDDPTGFLASILLESGDDGALSAECQINEDVFLRALTWHLRVASIYPEKWDIGLVKQLRLLGKLIEVGNLDSPPIVWYTLKSNAAETLHKYYPHELSSEEIESLMANPNELSAVQISKQISEKSALSEIFRLLKLSGDHMDQVDLVLPIYAKEEGRSAALGFFRINFDISKIADSSIRQADLQEMWRIVKEVHSEINKDVSRILLALENLYVSIQRRDNGINNIAKEVEELRLLMDTVHLFNEWVARKMRVFLQATDDSESSVDISDDISEGMIKFALNRLFKEDSRLIQEFDTFINKWKNLRDKFQLRLKKLNPEIILVSFWSLSRLPVINEIRYPTSENELFSEQEFTKLLLSDPGFLRMLMILQTLLKPGKKVAYERKNEGWEDVDFGVSTNRTVRKLEVSRSPNVEERILNVSWEQDKKKHSVVLSLDAECVMTPRRYLDRAVSSTPGVISDHLGAAFLTHLPINLAFEATGHLWDFESTDHNIFQFVSSQDQDELEQRFHSLESVMLYGEESAAYWKVVPLRPKKTGRPAFIAALYDSRIEREAVLTFRDIALANAKAFYAARESDAQYEAARELERNLASIRHGYNGPLRQLNLALGDTEWLFRKNQNAEFITEKMKQLGTMVKNIERLAEDAIRYASRKSLPIERGACTWGQLCEEIEVVIGALDRPEYPVVDFRKVNAGKEIKVKEFSLILWRHLLAKLIQNAIAHRDQNALPDQILLSYEISHNQIVLKIGNLISQENQEKGRIEQIREGLVKGEIQPRTETVNNKKSHGYGLIEAYNCCRLLRITPRVNLKKGLQVVISLSLSIRTEKEGLNESSDY